MSFTGKVVIVTGASAGIGAATAVAYAKQGAKLTLGGRNEEKLKKTARLCEEEGINKDNILLVLGDVTNEEVCKNIVDKTIEKFGRLDILVNNAGSVTVGDLETCTVQDIDLMFSVNVRSVFITTKCAMPHLKKSKGNIVNTSSIAAKMPFTGTYAYSMAKAALNQLTKCLAQDVGPSGVRVNCVMPGTVSTDIISRPGLPFWGKSQAESNEYFESEAVLHALGRIAKASEIADVILFVSSDAASFMTGAEVPVDGGASDKNGF